jgi:phosphoribosylformylglycinamidine synthase
MKKHLEPTFDFTQLNDLEAKKQLSENLVSLTPKEARYFQEKLGRPLTLTELTVLGIQGSEHCSYRSTRQYLAKLPTKGKYVIMGPGEDSGIVEIAKEGKLRWGLVISHESHNHPSQIVPYEGAATGVGGIVRDIVCMGAHVIGCLDCLRFGNLDKHLNRWLAREVIAGVAGYGNPLGVANIGGDIEFDSSFDTNCLVNVVAAGVLREDEIIHSYAPKEAAKVGYDIIIVGKPTDRSGFGGASFASGELKEEDVETNKGAVQEPNPFLERHILVATYDLFAELKKRKLLDKVSFKDMGAGGNVCASVEQLDKHGFGAEIDVEKIHTEGEHLPHIIACAETQERFCWVCHPKVTKLILDTYNEKWNLPGVSKGARASLVGKVKTGNYVLRYHGSVIVDAPAKLLTEGLRYNREYKVVKKTFEKEKVDFAKLDLGEVLKKLLASENIASRESIYEKYDKEVQGLTVRDAGKGSSAVIQPLLNTTASEKTKQVGVTIGVGGNATLGRYSARLQAIHAVCEAVANVASVGATPLALTDCLNYGNPEKPNQMGEFVEGIEGLREAAEIFETPFVSGNVSLYNENKDNSINPSALVACVGKLENINQRIPSRFQLPGNIIVLIGERSSALGGSEFEKVISKKLGDAFKIDLKKFAAETKFLLAAAKGKLIASARDLHRGGLLVETFEQALRNGFGFHLKDIATEKLFSENPGYIVEVTPANLEKLKKLAAKSKVKISAIGKILLEPRINVGCVMSESLYALRDTWENALREKLQK